MPDRQWPREVQVALQAQIKVSGVIGCKTTRLRNRRQSQHIHRRLGAGVDRQSLKPNQESGQLLGRNPLPSMRHDEAVADLVKPQRWNHRAFVGQAAQDGEAVLAANLVFQEPLEGQGSVDYQIAHRW